MLIILLYKIHTQIDSWKWTFRVPYVPNITQYSATHKTEEEESNSEILDNHS